MRARSWPLSGAAPWPAVAALLRAEAVDGLTCLAGEGWPGGTLLAAAPLHTATGPAAHRVLADLPEIASADPGAVVGGGWFTRLGWRDEASVSSWHDWVLRCAPDGRWWFECLDDGTDPERLQAWRRRAERVVVAATSGYDPLSPARLVEVRTDDPAEHRRRVRQLQEFIAGGEVYQANLCGRVRGRVEGDPFALWLRATGQLAPRYGGWLPAVGEVAALGGWSPELFLRRRGRTVSSSPVKGTIQAPQEGPGRAVAATSLLSSEKERAEHVMIVDLVRNDLGRVCATGSVTVPRLLGLDPAPGVWHLVSEVRGELRDGVDDAHLLAAAFPPGSVSGAPKRAALSLIDKLESWPRLAYTGAYGHVGPLAGLELAVTIRSLEVAGDGSAWIGVGGGVTAGSEPWAEWEECLVKAGPLVSACGAELPGQTKRTAQATPATRQ